MLLAAGIIAAAIIAASFTFGPAAASYIPSQDQGLDAWALNFSNVITANPANYGLLAADAVAITAAYTAYHTQYLLAGVTQPHSVPVNPATRTPVNIAAKDIQKAASLIVFRSYAQIIGADAGVSAGNKVAAGLTNRSTSRTPIPAPGTTPGLALVSAQPLQHILRFFDTSTPTVKAKPYGTIQMELWRTIGTVPPVSKDDLKFYGLMTKTPFVVDFDNADIGKNAYYFSRWNTRRGDVGPWSTQLQVAVI